VKICLPCAAGSGTKVALETEDNRITLAEYLDSLPPGDPRRCVDAYVEMKNKGPQNLDELRKHVIAQREWAAQAARIDNAAGGGLHDEVDYDDLVEDVQAIGLMALGLGRADVPVICSTGEFLDYADAAVLLDRVAKMLEAPVAPVPEGADLTAREAAAELRVSYDHVLRLIGRKELDAYKVGKGGYRVRRDDLERFKGRGQQATIKPKPRSRPKQHLRPPA
jgi:excisionase family DNA binding protein